MAKNRHFWPFFADPRPILGQVWPWWEGGKNASCPGIGDTLAKARHFLRFLVRRRRLAPHRLRGSAPSGRSRMTKIVKNSDFHLLGPGLGAYTARMKIQAKNGEIWDFAKFSDFGVFENYVDVRRAVLKHRDS